MLMGGLPGRKYNARSPKTLTRPGNSRIIGPHVKRVRGAILRGGLILFGSCAALFRRSPDPAPTVVSRPPATSSRSIPAAWGLPTPSLLPAPDPATLERALLLAERWSAVSGRERPIDTPALDPVPTRELVLVLVPGADPAAVAKDYGLKAVRTLLSHRDSWIFQAESPAAAVALRPVAARDPPGGRG